MIVTMYGSHKIKTGDKAGQIVPGMSPYRASCSWSDFVEMLRETSQTVTDPADKIRTISLSMADIEPGKTRANKYALGCDWIGIDLDNKPNDDGQIDPDQWTIETLVPWLDDQGLTYVIYTTSSCRENAQCLRLLLPLTYRVVADNWSYFWRGCDAWLGGKMDPQTKDVSRLLFEPRAWIGAYNRFVASPERKALDVDAILALVPIPVQQAPVRPIDIDLARATIADQRTYDGDLACLDSSPIIARGAVENALSSPAGGRLFKFLCACAVKAIHAGIEVSEMDMERLAYNMSVVLCRRVTGLDRDAKRALEWAENHVVRDEAQKVARFVKSSGGIF